MEMSSENVETFKGEQNYIPQPIVKCQGCAALSKKFDAYKDTAEKRYNNLIDILAEHKVLLGRIINQNAGTTNMFDIFPVSTEEKLKEFNTALRTHPDPFMHQIKVLLGGNVKGNLHQIFGHDIIMDFNVEGSFGKKRLKDYGNVYTAMIEVISSFDESADKILRAAFQRQKKKVLKQVSRNKMKNNKYKEAMEVIYLES